MSLLSQNRVTSMFDEKDFLIAHITINSSMHCFKISLNLAKKNVLIGYFFDKISELATKIQQIKNDF